MKKNKNYVRKYLKQYYANGCFVSIDGKHIERDYKDNGLIKTYNPAIYYNKTTCEEYVEICHKRTNVSEMVLTCYGGTSPKNGMKYIVHHKDGDFSNNNIRNLEWIEDNLTNQNMINNEIKAYKNKRIADTYKSLKIKANAKGEIFQAGQQLSYHHYIYDPDIDWFVHLDRAWINYTFQNRWGNYSEDRMDVDIVMNDFGFVSGDKALCTNPVILHLDNDFLNFESSNLVWCDKTDSRYEDYKKESLRKRMEFEIKDNRSFISKGIIEPGFKVRYRDVLAFASVQIP